MTALDISIRDDLSCLFNGNEMAKAKSLFGVILSGGKPAKFSTKGCPTHYGGKRDAATVFVNLNPGGDADINDCMFQKMKSQNNWSSFNDLISWYHKKCQVQSGCTIVDVFDLKTAVFLSQWPNCGIAFPQGFPNDKATFCRANEMALQQKLQLELLPYCSSSFHGIDKNRITELFPFLETVLEEIFVHPREYVIFASGKFEELFKAYNKWPNKQYDIDLTSHSKKSITLSANMNGSCHVIYLKHGADKSQKAIIAHTFPSYALPNSHTLMSKYGKECYDEFLKP